MFQSECLAKPSKIQVGETLCVWSKDDSSCALRSPPNDPIFLILVVLLTLVLVTPIGSLINHVLEHYARKSPSSRGFDDDITYDTAMGASPATSSVGAPDLFGRILPPASSARKGISAETSVEVAQFSYNGTTPFHGIKIGYFLVRYTVIICIIHTLYRSFTHLFTH